MYNFSNSFLLGLICTLFLFVMCVIITLGVKTLYLIYLDRIKNQLINVQPPKPKPKQKPAPTAKKPTTLKTIKQPKKAKIVRSIEIDPEQIDKIYVKKSG